ncbi:hypothetical protein M0804_006402 [Polistes exclamans]|nr:hypothetical protein M0804_006402 [Polistes exclamans]
MDASGIEGYYGLYMYRGKVNIPKNQLTVFVNAAESLQIKGLLESINNAMNKSLSNVPKIVSHLRLSSINISNVPPELTIKIIKSSERESFINDLSEDLYGSRMSKKLFSEENLHYPISNKRIKFIRTNSSEEDTSVEEYYEEFDSNDIPEQMIVPIATITPVTEVKTNDDPTDKSDSMIQ